MADKAGRRATALALLALGPVLVGLPASAHAKERSASAPAATCSGVLAEWSDDDHLNLGEVGSDVRGVGTVDFSTGPRPSFGYPIGLAQVSRSQDGTGSTTDYLVFSAYTLTRVSVHQATDGSVDGQTTTLLDDRTGIKPRHSTASAELAGEATYSFTLSRGGNLWRYPLPGEPGAPALVRAGLGNMSALAWHQRIDLGGERVDILFAITRYGRLWQIEVPVARPTQSTVRVLATRGFHAGHIAATARTPEWARGDCGGHSALLLTRYDTNDGDWFYLDTVHRPQPDDVHRGPRVNASWTDLAIV